MTKCEWLAGRGELAAIGHLPLDHISTRRTLERTRLG